jgi:hypothetical protein
VNIPFGLSIAVVVELPFTSIVSALVAVDSKLFVKTKDEF